MKKKISPAAIVALRDALTNIYWYKGDLRRFLTSALNNPAILSRLDWSDYKRNIIGSLVDFLTLKEDEYQADLLRLMTEVSRIEDYSHLEHLEDGNNKAKLAKTSVVALRKLTVAHQTIYEEQQKIEERRLMAQNALLNISAVKNKLEELTRPYSDL